MSKTAETLSHTPGPWEVGAGDDYYIRADAYQKAFPHKFKSDDLGDYLALVGNRTDDFGEANARLIAAAPELLRCLQQLHDDIAEYAKINNLGGFDNHCMRQARAAISLALSANHEAA